MTTTNPYDNWGDVQLPTSITPAFTAIFPGWGTPQVVPPADPCLAVILDFLATAIATDRVLDKVWRDVSGAGGVAPIKTIWLHNPKEVDFNSAAAPAFYMWRADPVAEPKWDCDDWLRDHVTVKGLWVFPIPGHQDNHRRRLPLAHVVAKAMTAAIELGRTPSWVQPNDPDKFAYPRGPLPAQGSLLYTFAGFDEFELVRCVKAEVALEMGRGNKSGRSAGYESYPALDFTFRMVELYETGLGKPPYLPDTSMGLTVTAGAVVDSGVIVAAQPPQTPSSSLGLSTSGMGLSMIIGVP